MTLETRGFSRVAAGFSSYEGDFWLPLVLAQGPSTEPLNDRNELMLLLQKIAALYLPLTQEVPVSSDPVSASFPSLLEERYLSVLYRRDELHTYVDLTTGETFRGYIRGIEKNACLRIETETGAIKSFAFKELKYIISQ